MTESPGFYVQMHAVLRDRLLDATTDLICADGWQAVTMSRIADEAGVSRQSVYNEIGGKTALAEAVVARETGRVLAGVIERLRAHGPDPVAGITAAVGYVLHVGADNPLVKEILTGGRGGDADLLPLVVTHPEPVLGQAVTVVSTEAQALYSALPLDSQTIGRLSEIIVRLTLSHLIQPTGPIDEALTQVRLLMEALLAGLTA